jgi:hypothetical protein
MKNSNDNWQNHNPWDSPEIFEAIAEKLLGEFLSAEIQPKPVLPIYSYANGAILHGLN